MTRFSETLLSLNLILLLRSDQWVSIHVDAVQRSHRLFEIVAAIVRLGKHDLGVGIAGPQLDGPFQPTLGIVKPVRKKRYPSQLERCRIVVGVVAAILAYCSPAWANSPIRKSRSAESMGDGFCSAAVASPEIAQSASITKSAKQIPADFIISDSASGGGTDRKSLVALPGVGPESEG
jgi:hypothetical protein